MFEKPITHGGLNAYRLVRAQTLGEVNLKASLQEAVWAERWKRKVAADRNREQKTRSLQMRTSNTEKALEAKTLALDQTRELEAARQALDKLLHNALGRNASPDWERKKDRLAFSVPKPLKPKPDQPPPEPDPAASQFNPPIIEPVFDLLDKLLSSRRMKKISAVATANAKSRDEATQLLQTARALWHESAESHLRFSSELNSAYEEELRTWQQSRDAFNTAQIEGNEQVDKARELYLTGDAHALLSYAEDVLSLSEYPDNFPREHRIEYIVQTKTIVLDFELPNLSAIPAVKEIKYVAARSEFQPVLNSDIWTRKTYDEVLYQIALRTLFELFQSDEANALVSVVFNGWVRSIDKATGAEVHACVMSLEARKDEFLAINLSQVEPKACFKKLKGVAASKLVELSPVKPLVSLNKDDKRFVEGYAVVDGLDERTNLAAMDWLDFENLRGLGSKGLRAGPF